MGSVYHSAPTADAVLKSKHANKAATKIFQNHDTFLLHGSVHSHLCKRFVLQMCCCKMFIYSNTNLNTFKYIF